MAFKLKNGRERIAPLLDQRAALKAQELRTEIIETLSTPGRGRTYTHYMATVGGQVVPVRPRNKPHRASAPGDAPAVDSGDLRRSIGVQKIGEGRYRVGTNLKHGLFLEFGTRRMAARPWLRPAAEKVRKRG